MKSRFFRNGFIPAIIAGMLLLVPCGLSGQGSKTNFTGSWAYNAEKSSTGQTQATGQGQQPGAPGRGGFGGSDFTATQEENILTVERAMRTPDGTTSAVTSKYTLDGKESVNTTRMGDSKSVATWSTDGKKLTIKTTRTMNRGGESRTVNSEEVWSLTDPKTLTIEMTMPSPQGERKMTSVYTKK
ncbi:MAG: hypothetical protein WAV93_03120 [Bacteroidales bacterium]